MASSKITPALKAVDDAMQKRLGPIGDKGDFNCRPFRIDGVLRPDKGWSEHAWGNAIDYDVYGKAKQQPYINMLDKLRNEGIPVGTVLWAGNRPNDHTDHIHVEGNPKFGPTGPPPCKGGPQTPGKNVDVGSSGGKDNDGKTNEGGTSGEETGSDVNWWDWVLDPVGTATSQAAEAFRSVALRIGYAVAAILLTVIVAVILVKQFADSQGIDIKALATRGIVSGS